MQIRCTRAAVTLGKLADALEGLSSQDGTTYALYGDQILRKSSDCGINRLLYVEVSDDGTVVLIGDDDLDVDHVCTVARAANEAGIENEVVFAMPITAHMRSSLAAHGLGLEVV